MNSNPTTLAEWLALLESRHPHTIEMGLARVSEVKQRLGFQFGCPVIVVGGTNGKGSTCAMLESILRHAGYRVGVYTSPHLLRFNERARLDGEPVGDAPLVAHFEQVEAGRGQVSLTYFEFTTLAILQMFADAKLDAVVLEVGLGGRLDAVNVVDADVAIVTNVDLDHIEYLGETRDRIGFQKAGIFRPGKVAICNDDAPPPSLIAYAESIRADLRLAGREFRVAVGQDCWRYQDAVRSFSGLPFPGLPGANQIANAAAVLAALEALTARLPVSEQHVRDGLAAVRLPGRFQLAATRPQVILDVAHNPHAAATLARNLASMAAPGTTYAVFGSMRDKDVEGVIACLRDHIDCWLLTDLPLPRAATAAQLRHWLAQAGIGRDGGAAVSCCATPLEAFLHAIERAGPDDRIVVFGSFLTVAGVLDAVQK